MMNRKFKRNSVTSSRGFSKVIRVPSSSENSASLPASACCEACGARCAPPHAAALCTRCALGMALAAGDDVGELPHALFPELDIEAPLARGGFGHVVKARHRRLERHVALKSLDDLLARSAETRALFTREMAVAGRLDHSGIVRAYDAGERDGHWYLITEFIDGMDTGALVRKHGRLPVAEACEIVRQAALALHYAHGRGLIHRDVKPGNLMLTSGADGPCAVKVLDFGLAAAAGAEGHAGGTPGYVAPEMLRAGTAADALADVFSLGATLRRFLIGQPPKGATGGEHSITVRPVNPGGVPGPPASSATLGVELPALPRRLSSLCDHCTAADPAQRPQSAAEVAALLSPWAHGADLARLLQEGPLPEKPRPAFWRLHPRATAVVIAAAVVLAGVLLWPLPGAPAAAAVKDASRPVFSAALMESRQLTPDIAPRLLTDEWETEFEIATPDPVGAARYLPDGRAAFLYYGPKGVTIRTYDGSRAEDLITIGKNDEVRAMTADPVSGRLCWSQLNNYQSLHLGRAERDGRVLPGLRFDFASEFPAGVFEAVRGVMIKRGQGVADAAPWGLAAVQAGHFPNDSGLEPGDVLIADSGHRNFGVVQSAPGLWRCRADSDTPAQRLCKLPVSHHFPLDVTIARSGVYLLNRSETMPSQPEGHPWNKDARIFRWDRDGLHRCLLRQPLHDPSGIAADPLSTDLYAIQGALLPSASIGFQRVLRLRLVAPDEYVVTPVADRFGKFSVCGIAFSPDGQHLLITDTGNRAVVGLRRTGGKK
jgi:tRNA A-37 threonylcarbamoyl transferase component Bud32